jgi:hypothetical protein
MEQFLLSPLLLVFLLLSEMIGEILNHLKADAFQLNLCMEMMVMSIKCWVSTSFWNVIRRFSFLRVLRLRLICTFL